MRVLKFEKLLNPKAILLITLILLLIPSIGPFVYGYMKVFFTYFWYFFSVLKLVFIYEESPIGALFKH